MASSTSTQNITIELSPWTDNSFNIDWISFKEELGGNLPTGNVSLIFPRDQEPLDSVINTSNGVLYITDNNSNGLYFEVPITVLTRSYDKNTLLLEFVGLPNTNFMTTRITATYSNINDAIQSLYPGEIDLRTQSDQNNNQELFQSCETGLDFLNRIMYTYKENTIFGYTWNGFMIKDILGLSYFGVDENIDDLIPRITGGGTGNLTNIDPYSMTYNKISNYKIVDPWIEEDNSLKATYQDYTPKNVTSIIGTKYYICRSSYSDLIKNFIKNSINFSTGFSGNYTITGTLMPNNYRIGDVVFYKRAEDDDVIDSSYYTKCLVYSNEIFMGNGQSMVGPHGFNFEWTSELRLIEDGPWCIVGENEVE